MKNKKIYLIVGLLLSVFLLSGCLKKNSTVSGPATLTIYGVDNTDAIAPIIAKYKDRQPNASIKYKKFTSIEELEKLVVNEIAEGEGPDMFYIPNGWLPRNNKKIVPLVSESLTPEAFDSVFVKVASNDFIQIDPVDSLRKIYALPLFVDTLALYYNKSHFEQDIPERGKPGPTWVEMAADAEKLRKDDLNLSLSRGAIAMGANSTITLAPDILLNLMVQAGETLYDQEYKQVKIGGEGQKQFDLFMSFSNSKSKNYSWDPAQAAGLTAPTELEAFLTGKVSSILAYSDLATHLENDIKNVKSRSNSVVALKDIAIVSSPQVSADENNAAVYAKYYGLAVSRNSKHQALAWDFLQFATSPDSARSYLKKVKRPTARRDLIEEQKKDPTLKVFVEQVGIAQSVPFFSREAFGTALRQAIDDSLKNGNARNALSQAVTNLNTAFKVEVPQGLIMSPKKKK